MSRKIPQKEVNAYWRWRNNGYSIANSALKSGISYSTANRMEAQRKAKALIDVEAPKRQESQNRAVSRFYEAEEESTLRGPIPHNELCAEAKRALEDFAYFRLRYFGRVHTPWQEQAAYILLGLLDSEDREFVVLNEPPGSGKTTLIHDFICWLICRNRAVRILLGSATAALAQNMLMRVRRSLERVHPVLADEHAKVRGYAHDAESTMSRDFGRMRPEVRELWTREAFIVMQPAENGSIEDKEPTLSAYGVDSGFIGGRFNLSIWDDLVDSRRTRSQEAKEQLEEWYTDFAETRLEPSGLHVLVGQRLAADDLYRYALDMNQPDLEDEDDYDVAVAEEALDESGDRSNKKYKHVKFKAHYEELCQGKETHKKGAPAYPDGCLLDPRRLPWRDLAAVQANRHKNFRVVYQQEDIALDQVLVQKDWVNGTADFVGCLDKDRENWEIPANMLARDCIIVATADPSPTQYWSVQCWLYHEPSKYRLLIDHWRGKMDAPDFLSYDELGKGAYEGLMEEWQVKSERLGYPISTWIIERNAAQRYLLQYPHVRNWRVLHGVDVRGHNTDANKADEEFGISCLAQHYRLGRVRLPWKGEAKLTSLKLVDEVTRYPHGRTADCVMAQWFFEWNLPELSIPADTFTPADIPAWVMASSF